MKRFIVSIFGVTVFCIGLGALAEQAGASFKSDEKALALIKQARLAIGGEPSIAEVRSMIVKGNTTVSFKIDGAVRTEQGETEIAMQFPDKLSKMVKIGRQEGVAGESIVSEKHDVMIVRGEGHSEGVAVGEGGKRVFLRKTDGSGGGAEIEKIVVEGKEGEFTTSDGKKVTIRQRSDNADVKEFRVDGSGDKVRRVKLEEAGAHHEGRRQNEMLRMTLSLLATPPAGMDVNYTYAGERDVDGTTCNVVNAEFAGSSIALYLSKTSHLPVMVSYQGHAMPTVMRFHASKAPVNGELKDKVITFDHKLPAPELAEIQVRYADYRTVNGVQLPYKWTTSVGGQTSEVFEVTNYEINPANIAEKFQNRKVFVRTKKEVN